jgi:hypothetical protein
MWLNSHRGPGTSFATLNLRDVERRYVGRASVSSGPAGLSAPGSRGAIASLARMGIRRLMARLLRTRSPLLRSANRPRLLAAAGLVILFGGLGVIVGTSKGTGKRQPPVPKATAQAPTIKPKPVRRHSRLALVRVPVTGVGAYDPEGDGSENDGDARLATDGNPASAWKSEHYRSAFSKSGVGLVVDAGRPVTAKRLIVATETPGFRVQVRVGESAKGPFTTVSKSKITSPTTTLALRSRRTRYLMLWITSMPQTGVAAVNEITVTAGD